MYVRPPLPRFQRFFLLGSDRGAPGQLSLREPFEVAFHSGNPILYFAHVLAIRSVSDSAFEMRCSCATSLASRAATRLDVVAAHPTTAIRTVAAAAVKVIGFLRSVCDPGLGRDVQSMEFGNDRCPFIPRPRRLIPRPGRLQCRPFLCFLIQPRGRLQTDPVVLGRNREPNRNRQSVPPDPPHVIGSGQHLGLQRFDLGSDLGMLGRPFGVLIDARRLVVRGFVSLAVDLSRFLRQTVKTQNPSNGELSHGIVS